jgi:hypothetical protein
VCCCVVHRDLTGAWQVAGAELRGSLVNRENVQLIWDMQEVTQRRHLQSAQQGPGHCSRSVTAALTLPGGAPVPSWPAGSMSDSPQIQDLARQGGSPSP